MTITGRIYKISSPQIDKIYIGSTTKALSVRFIEHRSAFKRYQRHRKGNNISSFEILKYKDAIIELLEENEFEDKNKMHIKERFYIESAKNTVNINRPLITKEEWKEQNISNGKLYRIKNKEKINERANEKFNCDCGGKYCRSFRASHNKSKRHINYITIQNTINIKDSEVIINNGK